MRGTCERAKAIGGEQRAVQVQPLEVRRKDREQGIKAITAELVRPQVEGIEVGENGGVSQRSCGGVGQAVDPQVEAAQVARRRPTTQRREGRGTQRAGAQVQLLKRGQVASDKSVHRLAVQGVTTQVETAQPGRVRGTSKYPDTLVCDRCGLDLQGCQPCEDGRFGKEAYAGVIDPLSGGNTERPQPGASANGCEQDAKALGIEIVAGDIQPHQVFEIVQSACDIDATEVVVGQFEGCEQLQPTTPAQPG